MNQNSIQEEIKSRLKTGNVCYHSLQNLLSSGFFAIQKFKDLNIWNYNFVSCFVWV